MKVRTPSSTWAWRGTEFVRQRPVIATSTASAAWWGRGAHRPGRRLRAPDRDRRAAARKGRSQRVRSGRRVDQEVVIYQPYAAVGQMTSGPRASSTSNREEVDALFGAALAAQPSRPTSYRLYFKENDVELDDASNCASTTSSRRSRRIPRADIVVVGHTDAWGNDTDNDDLSLRRAKRRRTMLNRSRLPAASIVHRRTRRARAARAHTRRPWRNQRNRRVEIVVR